MQVAEFYQKAVTQLQQAQIESAQLDAAILFEHITGIGRAFLAYTDEQLSSKQQEKISALLEKRIQRIPIAYLIGEKEFYGLNFAVNEHVLIPRTETEELVDYISSYAPKNSTMLEIGTGSGCISVATKHIRPDIQVTATDISKRALDIAQKNAQTHVCTITFIKSNLFRKIPAKKYHIICANLPYVPTNYSVSPETHVEPSLALYSGQDGLDHYREFFAQVGTFLDHDSYLLIEHNPEQYAAIKKLAHTYLDTHTMQHISEYCSVIRFH